MIKTLTIRQLGKQGELENNLTIPINPLEEQIIKKFVSENSIEKGVIDTFSEAEYIKLTADISHALMIIQSTSHAENKLDISLD